jgi:hypothetical protein
LPKLFKIFWRKIFLWNIQNLIFIGNYIYDCNIIKIGFLSNSIIAFIDENKKINSFNTYSILQKEENYNNNNNNNDVSGIEDISINVPKIIYRDLSMTNDL